MRSNFYPAGDVPALRLWLSLRFSDYDGARQITGPGVQMLKPRGMVYVPECTVDIEKNFLSFDSLGGFDMELSIKQRLPYWDKFDFPQNRAIDIGITPGLQTLSEEGIFMRSAPPDDFEMLERFSEKMGNSWSIGMAEMWVYSQVRAYAIHEAEEPGQWALCQSSDSLRFADIDSARRRIVSISLFDALPVPSDETSMDDVLRFKQDRQPELIAMRAAIDALYLEVVNSMDPSLAQFAALQKIGSALGDLQRVADESWTARLRAAVTLEAPAWHEAFGAAEIGRRFGEWVGGESVAMLATGAALGAALSPVRIRAHQAKFLNRIPASAKDFLYAFRVRNELQT